MRKILLVILALFSTVGALAQTQTLGPVYLYKGVATGKPVSTYTDLSGCAAGSISAGLTDFSCDVRGKNVPACSPAAPPPTVATIACPSGTAGSWQQTTTVTLSAPPACTRTTVLSPIAPPSGACTTTPPPPPPPPPGTALQMSPTGADTGDCVAAACKTFAYAFSKLPAGGELVLLDGTYTSAINWQGPAGSAQIPSGTATALTYVHAANAGKAIVPGMFIGRSTRKDSYIKVQGIRFEGDVDLYNTSFVTLKEIGVHGVLDLGTNDHDQGNTDNLIEDAWVWASGQRIIAINYRGHRNVWRRVVVRGDGCGTAACSGSGNPNVGFTVYDSHDVSVQNVIVLDRVLLASDSPYSDFAIASHTGGSLYSFGRNEWLGTISLKAPDQAYYMEPDPTTTLDPTVKVSNAVAWAAATGGFNLSRAGTNNALDGLTLNTIGGDALRVAPELAGLAAAKNVLVSGVGRFGVNSAVVVAGVSASGTWSQGTYNQTTPTGVVTAPAQKFITRIEVGSPLKGTGSGGADIGANVVNRVGADGTRFGDAGFNTLMSTSLWPWPNEARIKAEMCAGTTRGFCSPGLQLDGVRPVTLTSYIWEAMGNLAPF